MLHEGITEPACFSCLPTSANLGRWALSVNEWFQEKCFENIAGPCFYSASRCFCVI